MKNKTGVPAEKINMIGGHTAVSRSNTDLRCACNTVATVAATLFADLDGFKKEASVTPIGKAFLAETVTALRSALGQQAHCQVGFLEHV